jgi:hypothetical protein
VEVSLRTSHRLRIIVMPRAVYRRDFPDLSNICPVLIIQGSDTTNITFQTFTITYAPAFCPSGSCNATKRATIEQRDPICSTGATCECYPNLLLDKKLLEHRELTGNLFTGTLNCTELIGTTVNNTDCDPIIQYLQSLGSKPPIFIIAYTAF